MGEEVISWRTFRQTSSPSISGIIQSRMASKGASGFCNACHASKPLRVTTTSCPQFVNVVASRWLETASSSAISIFTATSSAVPPTRSGVLALTPAPSCSPVPQWEICLRNSSVQLHRTSAPFEEFQDCHSSLLDYELPALSVTHLSSQRLL